MSAGMVSEVQDVEPFLRQALESGLEGVPVMPSIEQDMAGYDQVLLYSVVTFSGVTGRFRARTVIVVDLSAFSPIREDAKALAHAAVNRLRTVEEGALIFDGLGITRLDVEEFPVQIPSGTVAQNIYGFQASVRLILRAL